MKKISSNEMERINGGLKLQTMCFGVGLMTAFAGNLVSLYYLYPAIKYCWNH